MDNFSDDAGKTAGDLKRTAGSALAGAADTLKNSAREAGQTGRDIALSATGIARGGAQRMAEAGGDARDAISGGIQDFPMTGALVCLGVGFLAGCLVSRRF
jgi:ElaB/YqjD/DUF883 family membrane-anchored ribosome-binding protein